MEPFLWIAALLGVPLALAGVARVASIAPSPTVSPPSRSLRGVVPLDAVLLELGASGPRPFRTLCTHPDVSALLAGIRAAGGTARLEEGTLWIDGPPAMDEARLDALADAIRTVAGARWRRVTSIAGLNRRAGATLRCFGEIDGFPVRVDAAGPSLLELEITVYVGLPPSEMRVGRFLALADEHPLARLVEDGVGWAVPPDVDPGAAVADAIAFAARLRDPGDGAPTDPFEALLARGVLVRTGPSTLEASLRGYAIDVRPGAPGFVVTVPLRRPLPPGTLLVHGAIGIIDERLGDPVLDPLLTVQSSAPDAVAARVSDEDVRGALLEVVHGLPGAQVREDAVVCPVPRAADLERWMDAAVALAEALDAPPAGVPDADRDG